MLLLRSVVGLEIYLIASAVDKTHRLDFLLTEMSVAVVRRLWARAAAVAPRVGWAGGLKTCHSGRFRSDIHHVTGSPQRRALVPPLLGFASHPSRGS